MAVKARVSADIAILGPGKVGTAIGVLSARAGLRVALAGRRPSSTRTAERTIGPAAAVCTLRQAAGAAKIVLLTVIDPEIRKLCEQLARARAFAKGSVVAHCSGLLSSEVLSSARRLCSCAVGSMHPLQTFPSVEAAAAGFAGTYCFCEGDAAAAAALEDLARTLGAEPVRITPRSKAAYHAAAVMACNHLAALMDASLALARQAGIEPATALPALERLVRSTVNNVFSMGPAEALTGPVARGDVAAVRRHLEAMRPMSGDLRRFYRSAAAWTIQLAQRKGTLDDASAKALRRVLVGRE